MAGNGPILQQDYTGIRCSCNLVESLQHDADPLRIDSMLSCPFFSRIGHIVRDHSRQLCLFRKFDKLWILESSAQFKVDRFVPSNEAREQPAMSDAGSTRRYLPS